MNGDPYDRHVSSDLTEMRKTFVRVMLRRGPKGTGLVEASEWIEVPEQAMVDPPPKLLIQLTRVATYLAGQLANQLRNL